MLQKNLCLLIPLMVLFVITIYILGLALLPLLTILLPIPPYYRLSSCRYSYSYSHATQNLAPSLIHSISFSLDFSFSFALSLHSLLLFVLFLLRITLTLSSILVLSLRVALGLLLLLIFSILFPILLSFFHHFFSFSFQVLLLLFRNPTLTLSLCHCFSLFFVQKQTYSQSFSRHAGLHTISLLLYQYSTHL